MNKTLRFFFIILVLPLLSCSEKDPLSPEQRLWLEKREGKINVALETNYPPVSFLNDAGEMNGISSDYLRLLEKKLGVRFNIVPKETLDEILTEARAGKFHVVPSIHKTKERSEYLLFSTPYVTIPNVLVVRKSFRGPVSLDNVGTRIVGIPKGYSVAEFVKDSHPKLSFLYTRDDTDNLKKLSFGTIDVAVIDLASASYIIERNGIANLRIAEDIGFRINLAFGFPKEHEILRGIFEKGLAMISPGETLEIREKWFFPHRRASFSISDTNLLLIILSLLFLSAFAILFMKFICSRKISRKISDMQRGLSKELNAKDEFKRRRDAEQLDVYLENCRSVAESGYTIFGSFLSRFMVRICMEKGGNLRDLGDYFLSAVLFLNRFSPYRKPHEIAKNFIDESFLRDLSDVYAVGFGIPVKKISKECGDFPVNDVVLWDALCRIGWFYCNFGMISSGEGVEISCALNNESGDDGTVHLNILILFPKTGMEIDGNLIFQPFSEWTGRGLGDVYAMLRSINASLEMESDESGYKIKIALPLSATDTAFHGDESGNPMFSGKVLIADCNEMDRKILATLFLAGGCSVVEAGSRRELLRTLENAEDNLNYIFVSTLFLFPDIEKLEKAIIGLPEGCRCFVIEETPITFGVPSFFEDSVKKPIIFPDVRSMLEKVE